MPVKDNILESLFTQSSFTNSVDDLKSFRDSLSQTILASKWLNYTTEITDPDIISKIEDKKITLSLKINNIISFTIFKYIKNKIIFNFKFSLK
jgi:hypothetical protein